MAYDVYNFPRTNCYDEDLNYLIKTFNELKKSYEKGVLDFSELKTRVDELTAEFNKLNNRESEHYTSFQQTLTEYNEELEAEKMKIRDNTTNIANNAKEISTLKSATATLSEKVEGNTNSVDELVNKTTETQTAVDGLTTTAGNLQKAQTELETRMLSAESAITENTRDIANLNTEIETDGNRISALEDSQIAQSLDVSYAITDVSTSTLNASRLGNLVFVDFDFYIKNVQLEPEIIDDSSTVAGMSKIAKIGSASLNGPFSDGNYYSGEQLICELSNDETNPDVVVSAISSGLIKTVVHDGDVLDIYVQTLDGAEYNKDGGISIVGTGVFLINS